MGTQGRSTGRPDPQLDLAYSERDHLGRRQLGTVLLVVWNTIQLCQHHARGLGCFADHDRRSIVSRDRRPGFV